MNSTIFYLNEEKTDFVCVKWEDGWKNTIVYRNKDKIGEIAKKEDLKFGRPFQSPDGKVVFIQLKGSIFGKPYLELLIDGNSYDFKEPTTEDKIHKTFKAILFIAGFNIFFGLVSSLFDIKSIDRLGFGYYSVIYGFIILGLGLAFRYKKSLFAIIILALLMIIEFVFYIKEISHLDIFEVNINGIFARLILIIIFIRGGYFIIQLRKEEKTQANSRYNA